MAPSPWKNRWRHLAGRMPWAQQLYRKLRPKAPFRDSASYWEGRYREGAHERHRKFTDWIDQHAPDFERLQHIPNKYPYDGNPWESSVSDFYIWGATHSPAP